MRGESTDKGVLDTSMKMDFSAETVAGISAYVSELVAAIQQGQEISETDLTNLQNIVTFLNGLDVTGTGQHVKEGVAQGMTEAGWESDAATVATNLQAALNAALGIHSPSTLMRPTGENVAAGVGAGMNAHDFGGEASALAGRLRASVTSAMSSSLLRSAGLNAMRGLVAGINAGRLAGHIGDALSGAGGSKRGQERAEDKLALKGIRGRGRRHGRCGVWARAC